jgi:hypothetical protein
MLREPSNRRQHLSSARAKTPPYGELIRHGERLLLPEPVHQKDHLVGTYHEEQYTDHDPKQSELGAQKADANR